MEELVASVSIGTLHVDSSENLVEQDDSVAVEFALSVTDVDLTGVA